VHLEVISAKCNTVSGSDGWEIVDILEGGLREEELEINFVEIDSDSGEGWPVYFNFGPGVDDRGVEGGLLGFGWGVSFELFLFGEGGVHI